LKKTTDELPEEAPLSISCKVQDSKLPFFPYLISLPQYKKYKTSNDNTTPLAAKNCMVFLDANNTFYCIEEVFTCILKKKQKSWILIMSTPFQAVSKFNIELTSGYPLEVNYLE
jgi:tRNA uridine 5-carbamoylmethylation protein Kti12